MARIRLWSNREHISLSSPVAEIENPSAASASISRKKFNATAAASNPDPRFAEVAGKRILKVFVVLLIPPFPSAFPGLLSASHRQRGRCAAMPLSPAVVARLRLRPEAFRDGN